MNLRRSKKLEDDEIIYLMESYSFAKNGDFEIEITYPNQPKRKTLISTKGSSRLWFTPDSKRSTLTINEVVKTFFIKYYDYDYNLIILQAMYNNKFNFNDVDWNEINVQHNEILFKVFKKTGKLYVNKGVVIK